MNETYQETRQRFLRSLRTSYPGRELLSKAETVRAYGYKDPRNADEILKGLPACIINERPRYHITDIASDMAKRYRSAKVAS